MPLLSPLFAELLLLSLCRVCVCAPLRKLLQTGRTAPVCGHVVTDVDCTGCSPSHTPWFFSNTASHWDIVSQACGHGQRLVFETFAVLLAGSQEGSVCGGLVGCTLVGYRDAALLQCTSCIFACFVSMLASPPPQTQTHARR
eukprot:TRINITY_DN59_c0_g1_i7.p3 TRINITY_DN59_c0_g1~~TRINITY_DN59_c0_g1_i7.p3  ORF type:complete len:142 (+),score=6.93 TRINITY_DN59_c0_g1_i7:332-757(+)